jgi:hypothetical protein
MAGKDRLNLQGELSMRSGGYYSERTVGARIVIDNAFPMVRDALASVPADRDRIRLADFGCADGGTSQGMWARLIDELRAGGDGRDIEMIYTDLPSNDFSTLFKRMQGIIDDPAKAYQTRHDGVFVHGCGTGFHRQLMGAGTLDLGFSATAMHYVSEKPTEIAGHVHMVGAAPDERAAFEAQAAQDWEAILLARATELVSGGRFVCVNFGIDEQGRYLGATGGVNMFDRFAAHWRALVDEGAITEDEFRRATFVQHYRTVEEFTAPFRDPASAVSKAGLVLKSAHTTLTRCPFEQAFAEADGAMSARDFAESYIPTLRSWSETVFKSALSDRPAEEALALVDRFYRAYEDEVAADPTGHAMDYVHVVLDVEKQAT